MGERVVDLTTYEFDLLYYLANRAGEVVSRQDIYQALFNYDYDGLDRSVDVYISRLRQNSAEIMQHLFRSRPCAVWGIFCRDQRMKGEG